MRNGGIGQARGGSRVWGIGFPAGLDGESPARQARYGQGVAIGLACLVAWGILLAAGGAHRLQAQGPAVDIPPTQIPPTQSPPEDPSPGGDARNVAPLEFVPVAGQRETWVARADRAFGQVVQALANVLFYEVLARSEQYVQLSHVEHYQRPHGSVGPYLRRDPQGDYPAQQLTDDDVDLLRMQGKLQVDASGNVRRIARQSQGIARQSQDIARQSQDIAQQSQGIAQQATHEWEVVSCILDTTSQFVWDPQQQRFRKQLPPRQRLSDRPEDARTREQIDLLGAQGRLAVDAQGHWIQVRRVHGAPIVVVWLAAGAIFFTLYLRGVNFWGFFHALAIVRGKYDDPHETGEVTHFQALASALSATIGLGNIAGVTLAMTTGGPGAFFWMTLFGLLGMASKFVECTLGQKYRLVRPDGTVSGGPMHYLKVGLAELGWGRLGACLSTLFAVMCILGSIGGGNMFQANQSGGVLLATWQASQRQALFELSQQVASADESQLAALQAQRKSLLDEMDQFEESFRWGFGLLLAAAVGIVIVGGIRRIAAAAEWLVPGMCVIYVVACLSIIFGHAERIPALLAEVWHQAFTGSAVAGGWLGVLVTGVRRAAFSNEAGIGSAAIAHSAARTEFPIREGLVALLEPFIDTVVVCSMTALVILITGAWDNHDWIVGQGAQGTALTALAFRDGVGPWFTYVLALAVLLFAYSTIISWSYYGERCWEYLLGLRSVMVFRCLYVACVCLGSVVNAGAVLDFSDMMILAMAFPNVIGCVLLVPGVRRDLIDYWRRYRAGEFSAAHSA